MTLAQMFPYSVWECWWLAPVALILDLWLGDPDLPWRHPVCLVGKLLDRLEAPARRFMLAGGTEAQRTRGRLAGLLALAVLVALTGLAVWGLVSLPVIGALLALYLAWAGLAMGSLLRTGCEVLRRVEHYDEPAARDALSWLVSRDTSSMDRPLMRKTLADTLSENLTDAFMAPFFWLLLGGPVAMWCYKAVSTTDSMWGYVTEKWRWLGWAGARSDDALAYVPARLSACATWLANSIAGALLRQGGSDGSNPLLGAWLRRLCPAWLYPRHMWQGRWPGLRVVARQAVGMPSPNSGWSMTACAWLCGARMGGPSVYFGTLTPKPWLGPEPAEASPWGHQRLLALCELLRYSALCGGLALWLCALVLRLSDF